MATLHQEDVSTMFTRLSRFFTVLSLLLVFSPGAFPQEKTSFFEKVKNFVIAPSRSLDPDAVYQPNLLWNVGIIGDLRQARTTQVNDFAITYESAGNAGTDVIMQARMDAELKGSVGKSVGLQVGFGNVTLGWNQQIGRSREYDDRALSFDLLSSGYALQLQYFYLSRPIYFDFSVRNDKGGYERIEDPEFSNPARLRAFIADGFYAFNRRTFAYSAVYKGGKFQRRSAGSFMFGSKLISGTLEWDPEDLMVTWLGGIGRQVTTQVAFGGGVAYNLVALHRQPGGNGLQGLKNLTFNLTAIPMVTLFNQFVTTVYHNPDGSGYVPASKNTMNGNLLVNYVARAGAIYSWDNFSVNLSGSYDSYSYKGVAMSLPFIGEMNEDVKTSGFFERWTVGLGFRVRF